MSGSSAHISATPSNRYLWDSATTNPTNETPAAATVRHKNDELSAPAEAARPNTSHMNVTTPLARRPSPPEKPSRTHIGTLVLRPILSNEALEFGDDAVGHRREVLAFESGLCPCGDD